MYLEKFFTLTLTQYSPDDHYIFAYQHIQCSCRNNSLGGRSKKRFELSALGTVKQALEGAPEVGVEHVVDNGVDNRATVGQPLEGRDDGRCHIVTTGRARTSQQVGGEEGQVEHNEGGEKNAKNLHGSSALVGP